MGNDKDAKITRIIITIDASIGGSVFAEKVRYDEDSDEDREILSEEFDTNSGTWISLSEKDAKEAIKQLIAAIASKPREIG